jgi:hypothetical protein
MSSLEFASNLARISRIGGLTMNNETLLSDSFFHRDRSIRRLVFFATPLILVIGGALVGGLLLLTFFDHEGFFYIGGVLGATGGAIFFLSIKHKFFVKNPLDGFFMTHNPLASLMGGDSYTYYGPGTHFCLPWESRSRDGVFSFKLATEEFTFSANCRDGTIFGKGSYRLRPDPSNPRTFLTNAGTIGSGSNDLIKSFIASWLADKTINESIVTKQALNSALHSEFATGDSQFERRFGVQVVDLIISELQLNSKVERTRNALHESQAALQGAARLLGFNNANEMNEALANLEITRDDINRAMRDFLVISGKSRTTIRRFEIDLE